MTKEEAESSIEDWSAEQLITAMTKEAEQLMIAGKSPDRVFRDWGYTMYVWWQCNYASPSALEEIEMKKKPTKKGGRGC